MRRISFFLFGLASLSAASPAPRAAEAQSPPPDPRARNLWFDVATVVTPDISARNAARVATRIRQLGVGRILYGSDTPDKDHLTPRKGWAAFHDLLPLTEAELRTIANNAPPYGR